MSRKSQCKLKSKSKKRSLIGTSQKRKQRSTTSKMTRKSSKKRRTLPVPHQGMLGRYGYHGVKFMPEIDRHRALKRAIKGDGYRKTIGHLVLISNYTSRSDPAAYAIFKRDQEWVSMMYKKFKAHQK